MEGKPIPYTESEAYKKLFGKQIPPRLLKDFDAIGFDADFTLLQYKVIEQQKMQYAVSADVLIKKKGYPVSIAEMTDDEFEIYMDGVLMDGNTGCILKLGPDFSIISAYRGSHKLTRVEIEEAYGKPAKIESYNFMVATDLKKSYMCAITCFKISYALLFKKVVDLIISKQLAKTFSEAIIDIAYSIKKAYYNWNKDGSRIKKMATYGAYYPEITKNTSKYLAVSPESKKLLMTLKSQGISLFLVSNSHFDYIDYLMTFAYGEDWKKLFDYIIVGAKKPSFFSPSSSTPMRCFDSTVESCKGPILEGNLKLGGVYLEGNYKYIESTILKEKGLSSVRLAYVGDNFIEDSIAPALLPSWKAITILPELNDEITGKKTKFWGSFFFNKDEDINLWVAQLLKLNVFPVPTFNSLSNLIIP